MAGCTVVGNLVSEITLVGPCMGTRGCTGGLKQCEVGQDTARITPVSLSCVTLAQYPLSSGQSKACVGCQPVYSDLENTGIII